MLMHIKRSIIVLIVSVVFTVGCSSKKEIVALQDQTGVLIGKVDTIQKHQVATLDEKVSKLENNQAVIADSLSSNQKGLSVVEKDIAKLQKQFSEIMDRLDTLEIALLNNNKEMEKEINISLSNMQKQVSETKEDLLAKVEQSNNLIKKDSENHLKAESAKLQKDYQQQINDLKTELSNFLC